MPAQLGLLVLFAGNVFAAAPCQGYTGVVSGGDCRKQWCPHPLNEKAYPKWHYCKRVPDDPDTRYSYLWQTLAPADVPYHKCSAGKVLRHDASGLICADYTQSDFHAGVCTDRTCCTGGVCSDYTCPAEWTKRATADSISCFFGCDEELCCDPPVAKPVPREHAQGMLFVDKDPGRFVFGGNVTILRAIDESDITHYRVYWGFAQVLRKVPSCGLKNPVSWNNEKARDPTKMLGEFKKTGCDITFEIPMGTKATDYERCPITWDRSNRNTAGTDECNPHYLMVVSVNENGEKPVTRENIQQLGPRHPISDYEAELGLTCAESGITGGHDLPGEYDIVLGKWNDCPSAAECAKRCREYDGSKGACRQWTWAYNNGGSTSKTCWMESQTLTKTHYGVRVQGPAVCPTTSESNAPTGRERPRCTRWQRFQNKVPWTNPGNYNPWLYHKNGNNYVQRPTDPDVPLGTYQHAEYCKGLCDLDVLCTGFVFQKRLQLNSGTFKLLKKCVLMREDTFERNTPTDGHEYDTWVCSREGMAPLVNGYTFEVNRFGYVTCGAATASSQTVMDSVDCCASACDADVGCVAFTFWNKEKRCDLFSSCASTAKVDKVEGCAFESCFDGFGASTYKKIAVRTIEVVDRWPRVGSKDGIPVRLQTNGMMDGAEVVCGVVHIAERNEIPKTAEDMKADASLAGVVVSAIVENDVASLELKREKAGALMDGVKYTLRCAVVGASQYGLPAYFDTAIQLQEPRGYHFLRHGRCTSHSSCTTKTHEKGRGHTLDKCKALCEAQKDCRGFSYGANDGWCRWFSGCNLLAARPALHVYCFKREAAWDKLNDPKGECADTCSATDTCNFKRELGVYDRNVFTPNRNACLTPAPDTAAPTAVPTAVHTSVPTALPTAVPTAATPGFTLVPPVTAEPTSLPTAVPTAIPTGAPPGTTMTPPVTAEPTTAPTATPTAMPTAPPSGSTLSPPVTAQPTEAPTQMPTRTPTSVSSGAPSVSPPLPPTDVPDTPSPAVPSPTKGVTNAPGTQAVVTFGGVASAIAKGWWTGDVSEGDEDVDVDGNGNGGGDSGEKMVVVQTGGGEVPRVGFSPKSGEDFAYLRETLGSWPQLGFLNRMSFYVQVPEGLGHVALGEDKNLVVELTTRDPSAAATAVGTGGKVFEHRFRVAFTGGGGWQKVVVDPHPDAIEGVELPSGTADHGVVTHPLQRAGVADGTSFYFDYVTRMRISFAGTDVGVVSGARGAGVLAGAEDGGVEWSVRGTELWRRDAVENEAAVYGLTGAAFRDSAGAVSVEVAWSRSKDDPTTAHEVRYLYTSIHVSGFALATVLTTVKPSTADAMQVPAYASKLDTAAPSGTTSVFVAVRPVGAAAFTEIELPLQTLAHSTPAPHTHAPSDSDDGISNVALGLAIAGACVCATLVLVVVVCLCFRRKQQHTEGDKAEEKPANAPDHTQGESNN